MKSDNIYILVILLLIIIYLSITSGLIDTLRSTFIKVDKKDDSMNDKLLILPGMFGSLPDDKIIDVYDSNTLVILDDIDSILNSYQISSKNVLQDFIKNRNSIYYKTYAFNDYKLYFLKEHNKLSDDQIYKYLYIHDGINKNIKDLIDSFINEIKLDGSVSYSSIQNIINKDILINTINYVFQEKDISMDILSMLNKKLDVNAQQILKDLYIANSNNSYLALYNLKEELLKKNEPIYTTFLNNNIDHSFITLFISSFLTEKIYYSMISDIIHYVKNLTFTENVKKIIILCKQSRFRLIYQFPYRFSYKIIIDSISKQDNFNPMSELNPKIYKWSTY